MSDTEITVPNLPNPLVVPAPFVPEEEPPAFEQPPVAMANCEANEEYDDPSCAKQPIATIGVDGKEDPAAANGIVVVDNILLETSSASAGCPSDASGSPAKEPASENCLTPVVALWKHYFPKGLIPHDSVLAGALTFASATLGVGTLSIPGAVNSAGGVLGPLFLIICAAGTVYAVRLLVWTHEITGYNGYEEMSRKLIAPWFEKMNSFFILIFCWGISVVYITVMGDLLKILCDISGWPDIFQGDWGLRLMTTLFWAIFMLPLCLSKQITALRYSSVVGMTAITVLIITVVVHAGQSSETKVTNINAANGSLDMVLSLPVIIFSYCCQTNSFEVYAELKDRSVSKMTWLTGVTMTICTALYILVGCAGSMEFGNATDGNILNNYENPTGTAYIVFAYVCMIITLTFAFPVVMFPTRDTCLQTLGYFDVHTAPTHVRLAVSGVLAVSSIILGMFAPDVSILFGLLGGICGSTLSFIWPALFFMRSGKFTVADVGIANIIATWALFIIGAICGVLGTAISIYEQTQA